MAHDEGISRRQEILAAAERVFEACGYAAATMDAVAEEAGISKGSIYNYFSSKQDLFQQIFSNAVTASEETALAAITKPIPAKAKLEGLLDYWFSRLSYHRRVGRLFLEFWATAAREQQGQLAASFAKTYAEWRQRLAGILAEGVAGGEFRPDIQTVIGASLIMAILDGIEVQSILDIGIHVDEEFLAALKRAILVALSVGGDGRGESR